MMNRFQTSPAQVRDELARLMGAALHEGVRRLFAQVERQLFDLASSERDDARRAEAFEAIAEARAEQDGFFRGLSDKLLGSGAATDPVEWHELIGDRSRALLFEDALADAKQRCGTEHAQFEARIGQLHSDDPEAVPADLYTMESISQAFLAQTRDLPDALRHRLIAHWADQVLNRLAPIYSVLNDYLIQVGVLPGIKRLRNPLDEVDPALQITPPPDTTTEEPRHDGPNPEALADRLVPLVRATIAGDDQYLFRFERDQDWRAEAFAEFIMDRIEPTLPLGNWPTRSRDLIRLVGMTFSDVLNDELIDPRHRRQIAALQLAVLLLAARDRHFLADADHPARRIINLMALIGSDPDLKPDVQATADMLVPIQEAIVDAPERLEVLADQMRDISRGKPVEPEAQRPSPARDRLALIEQRCRVRVDKILAGHVADMPLREPARDVLAKVFQPFMVRTMINQGRQSAPWAGIITLLQDTLTLQIDPTIERADVDDYRRHATQLFNETAGDGLLTEEQQALDGFIEYLDEQARQMPEMSIPKRPVTQETEQAAPASSPSAEPEYVMPAGHELGMETPDPADLKERAAAPATAESAPAPEPDSASDPTPDTGESIDIPSPIDLASVEPNPPSEVDEPANATEAATATERTEPTPAEESASGIPRDGLFLASLDFVQAFFDQQVLSEEWFEVYTGPGRALRRLKIRNLDSENGVINFANRTGQAKLTLPVAQVIDDLLEERTRLVFDNPRFVRATEQLRTQLEEARDER
ncbi:MULTISPECIES: DUF1631 family protein [unclassified Guyparkeria]|uniref:DUF1631 family protein n=1 Tax=unclassified Guyparkeria TaxID=2626246 RepID=UPI00073394B0|nr:MULTISPECIES: DUF1631 family protein [unclassified Guyparkeria]KTG17848.1 hypothetical protein AUR63_06960 [Guyparkeria sp. XI15]OAE89559.1 hypothetical protein AWR35_06970 [Guyparkeria sp. WRN-7]